MTSTLLLFLSKAKIDSISYKTVGQDNRMSKLASVSPVVCTHGLNPTGAIEIAEHYK